MLELSGSISSEKIMLSRDQALQAAWGSDKQKEWGELTNMAILMTSDMLKKGKFKNITELYYQLVNERVLIGYLLKHPFEIGQAHARDMITDISKKGRYGNMYSEFASLVESLQESNQDYFKIQGNSLQIMGVYEDDSQEKVYARSKIEDYQGKKTAFRIWHVQDPSKHFYQAEKQFKKLTQEKQLSIEEKRACIEAIYYYLADAMPCKRGSAAIAEMLFYSLEDAFTDKMRYIGKMKSEILPDLAAMLSPSLEDFRDYFNRNAVNSEIVVEKKTSEIEIELIPIEEFIREISEAKEKIEEYKALIEKNGVNDRNKIKVYQKQSLEKLITIFEYIKNSVEKNKEDVVQVKYYQNLYRHVKDFFVSDFQCYYDFYSLVKDKNWPPPVVHDYNDFISSRDLRYYNQYFFQNLYKLERYYSLPADLVSEKGKAYREFSTELKLLRELFFHFEERFTFENFNFYLNFLNKKTDEIKPFYTMLNERIGDVSFFENEKKQGIPKERTIENRMERIEGALREEFKNKLSDLYDDIESQKSFLINLPPFVKEKLDYQDVLKEWQKEAQEQEAERKRKKSEKREGKKRETERNEAEAKKREEAMQEDLVRKFDKVFCNDNIFQNLQNLYQQKRTEEEWRLFAQNFNILRGRVLTEKRTLQLRELAVLFSDIKGNKDISAEDKKEHMYGLFTKIMKDIEQSEPGNMFKSRLYALCKEWRDELGLNNVNENEIIQKYEAYKKGGDKRSSFRPG